MTTPGTVRRSAQGSRAVGMAASSLCVKLVAVPVAFASTSGVSPLTVTVSATDASCMVIGSSTLCPSFSAIRSRTKTAKPGISNRRA